MTSVSQANRIVVKIGSSLLVDPEHQGISKSWLDSLVDDLYQLISQGKEILIVSSGAVALGRKYLNLHHKKLQLDEKQASAACGQVELVEHYQRSFRRYQVNVAQVLLTLSESENRRRYLNARGTLEALISCNVIPVINENDTVATQELRFGDNDRLAARVGQMVAADLVILLSDIDGLYTENPHKNPQATFVKRVEAITPDIEAMAGSPESHFGSGGMITKLAAAKIATSSGTNLVITQGHSLHPLKALIEGGKCTWFIAKDNPISARKHWISGSLSPVGEVFIDDGAVQALGEGKSLLPIGVKEVVGYFDRGDAILIKDMRGIEIARGIATYPASEAKLICGKKSNEIELVLGYVNRTELVHRDDLVMRS